MTRLLQNAVYGTALILAAAALRRMLGDRLIPQARLALWAVCLFRLLTPAAPESVLSLWGLSRLFQPQQAPAAPAPAPVPSSQLYVPALPDPSARPAPQPDPGSPWEAALCAVWLLVGLALAVRYLRDWRRTRRAVSCAIPLERSDPRYAPLPSHARLREGPMEGAPLTFGVVRPTVVLSPGLSGEELACVLAHEGVHAQRRDNLWHYAMALALIVHWWDPAVWLMARLLRRDIELACDRAALKKLGADRRAGYAKALVSLSTQAEGPAFCQTFGRKAAEERIMSIMRFKKTSAVGVVLTLALVLGVTVAFASEPKAPDEYDSVMAGSIVNMDFDTRDDIVFIPNIGATRDIQSDFPEVDPDDVDLSIIKEKYAQKVADGELTQEQADEAMTAFEDMLEQARRGEVKLFMDPDGWIYGSGVSTIYYRDEDGELTPVDPSTVSSAVAVTIPVPSAAPQDAPVPISYPRNSKGQTYGPVPYGAASLDDYPDLVPIVASAASGWKDGYVLHLYGRMCHPSYPGAVTCPDEAVKYMEWLETQPETLTEPLYDANGDVIGEYQSPNPARSTAAPAKDFDGYTIVGMDENGYPLDEQGYHLVFDENGGLFMKFRTGYGPCIKEDCPIAEAHYHKEDGQAVPLPESNAPTPVFEPDGDPAVVPSAAPEPTGVDLPNIVTAPSTSCGVEGCAETRYHAHADGLVHLLSDPCPVEGCTITGNHIHGDTVYSCNGAGHSGGSCDGSCYIYFSSDVTPTSASSHHSEGHHSDHH